MNDPAAPLGFASPTPIVVGVTGHRDIAPADFAELENSVHAFFEQLRARYPNSGVLVLTGLAEGADQLVARVALARKVPYVALLPMPRNEYVRDFSPGQSRDAFERALASAALITELPMLSPPETQASREEQYATLGLEIVRHSAILLALYDGHPTQKPGGTDDVMALADRGVAFDDRSILAGLEHAVGPHIHQIVAPRGGRRDQIGRAFSAPDLRRVTSACLRSLGQQDRWNRDAVVHNGHGDFRCGSDLVMRTFETADAIAVQKQRGARVNVLIIYAAAFASALAFGIYAHVASWPGVVVFDVVISAAAFAIFWFARKSDIENRFQDYRALAEGLRVQHAWSLIGIDEDVTSHYLRKQRAGLDWIRRTIRVAQYLAHICEPATPLDAVSKAQDALLQICSQWIEPQRSYFERASAKNEIYARRYRFVANVFAILTASALVVLAVYAATSSFPGSAAVPRACVATETIEGYRRCAEAKDAVERHRGWLLAFIGLAAVGGALVQDYSQKLGFEVQAHRYEATGAAFTSARDELDRILAGELDAVAFARAQRLVVELGDEALSENGDWVQGMREHPLELVQAA